MKKVLVGMVMGALLVGSLAYAKETIREMDDESARFHVSQIVDNQKIKDISVFAQVTTVYSGGIAAPFGIILSVWDPVSREDSDLGTSKQFNLGYYSDAPKIISKRLKKVSAKSSVLELTLRTSLPDQSMISTRPVTLKLAVPIGEEEVGNSITLTKLK